MENINRIKPCGIIKYYIFINNVKNVQDNKTHLLSKIANECIRYVSALAKEYIWHYETFNLRPIINDDKNVYDGCIGGSVDFQGNMIDEWFIVYLLYNLSTWEKYDFFIQIIDDDGQFLLAEAADALPSWAEPDTCENRLFLNKGCFKLLSMKILPGNPSFKNVLNYMILANESDDIYVEEIDQIIKRRIHKMPNILKDLNHNTLCYMPLKGLLFLKKYKELIPLIVNEYYYRSKDDVEMCHKAMFFFADKDKCKSNHSNNMSNNVQPDEKNVKSELELDVSPLFPVLVKMTRLRYSQIINDQYIKPKCMLKSINNTKCNANKKIMKRQISLGIKLTCGLEILARSYGIGDWNYRFDRFIESLQKKKYFKNTLVGSKEYNNRLKAAEKFFYKQEGTNHVDGNGTTKFDFTDPGGKRLHLSKNSIGEKIYNFLNNVNNEEEELLKSHKAAINEYEIMKLENEEDDDNWIHIDYDEFLNETAKQFKINIPKTNNNKEARMEQNVSKLNNLTATLQDFLNTESNYEGIDNNNTMALDTDSFFEILKSFNVDSPTKNDIHGDHYTKKNVYSDDVDTGINKSASKKLNIGLINRMMDEELSSTTAFETFNRVSSNNQDHGDKNNNNSNIKTAHSADKEYELQPIDLDYNLVSNILEAFKVEKHDLQNGIGPVSILLNNLEETSDVNTWIPSNVDND